MLTLRVIYAKESVFHIVSYEYMSTCMAGGIQQVIPLIFFLFYSYMVQFYEELVHGKASGIKCGHLGDKPLNKKTKFTYSESSSSDEDDDDDDENSNGNESGDHDKEEDKGKPESHADGDASLENPRNADLDPRKLEDNKDDDKEDAACDESRAVECDVPPAKKQCVESNASEYGHVKSNKMEEKSVDRLIEAELAELGDRNKVSE